MLKVFHVWMLFLGTLQLTTAEPRDTTPPKQSIRFPEQAQKVPTPGAISILSEDRLYVIDSDAPLIVISSPEGLVSIHEDAGPLKIRGRFVDGDGGVETRTYKGKSIYSVEGVKSGKTEIIVIPTGLLKSDQVIRKQLVVQMGQNPNPPPAPDDGEGKVDPIPPTPPKADHVWIIVVEETSQRTPEISSVLGNRDYWETILKRGHSWRFYDKDSVEARNSEYASKAIKIGLPAVFVVDKNTGDILKSGKLPTTTSGLDEFLKGVAK